MSRAVAIVGSGPSGCYLAQALLKAAPALRVDLIDRLPVPYGWCVMEWQLIIRARRA
ncbi:NADPH-ferredoxin reductase [Nitratireductor aquibiodomus RA22]|uniref:NADPH-ferredoxin reductase n=1 Tax=Nitratireductor aquibiodomus RA22 TaxID=1189611 RepID=I5BUF9_9HYPH|nr:NAD(P)-binding protein [Nitratireductor aquibiodomus]EIM73211.1 NADPH-ferredoxin reductase [Nitratireductor aquibiodomus RA22]